MYTLMSYSYQAIVIRGSYQHLWYDLNNQPIAPVMYFIAAIKWCSLGNNVLLTFTMHQ